MPVYDAVVEYKKRGTDLIVVGGKEYGTGSSRDWAAKGTKLLGVKVVIAESFERIHRSNLIGMGILPLQFTDGINRLNLKLRGSELISVLNIEKEISPADKIAANFFLLDFDSCKKSANYVAKKLENKGIILRSMESYKMKNKLRMTIGSSIQNKKFIKEIKNILR